MTELDELKYRFFEKSMQLCILNKRGFVVYTCNTLVNFNRFKALSTLDELPMLESIWTDVLHLDPGSRISLTRLEMEFEGKSGYYDYHFEQYPEDTNLIAWYIVDQTSTYSAFQNLIQQRNEIYIKNNS